MAVKIYHNPRCSKSRQTLQLLNDQGVQTEVVEYLKNPPSVAELEAILSALQIEARALLRKGEEEYKTLGLENLALTQEQLIRCMCDNPKLIERPIVVNGAKATLGRPPENVLAILD